MVPLGTTLVVKVKRDIMDASGGLGGSISVVMQLETVSQPAL
jgi:lipopolysaccharide export system protein LptA